MGSATLGVRGPRLAILAAAAAALVLGALLAGPERARASHAACSLWAWAPVKYRASEWVYITFKMRADCLSNTPGRAYLSGSRQRWWGWQVMVSDDAALHRRTGARSLKRDLHCNRNVAGWYTWQTKGMVGVMHPWTGTGIREVYSAKRRYHCRNTGTGS